MSSYPITITQARYGGAYEALSGLRSHLDPHDIPEEAFADDVTCVSWWLDHGLGSGKDRPRRRQYRTLSGSRSPSS
jgi:hypothetical protein